MSTAEELIRDAQNAVSGMVDDLTALEDFTGQICLLLTSPDFEGECPRLHWLVRTAFNSRSIRPPEA